MPALGTTLVTPFRKERGGAFVDVCSCRAETATVCLLLALDADRAEAFGAVDDGPRGRRRDALLSPSRQRQAHSGLPGCGGGDGSVDETRRYERRAGRYGAVCPVQRAPLLELAPIVGGFVGREERQGDVDLQHGAAARRHARCVFACVGEHGADAGAAVVAGAVAAGAGRAGFGLVRCEGVGADYAGDGPLRGSWIRPRGALSMPGRLPSEQRREEHGGISE